MFFVKVVKLPDNLGEGLNHFHDKVAVKTTRMECLVLESGVGQLRPLAALATTFL